MTFKPNLKKIRTFTLGLLILVIGLGVGYKYALYSNAQQSENKLPQLLVGIDAPTDYQTVDFSLFWEVWSKLEREYLDTSKIDKEAMVYGAIQGMVSSLEDPYTVFLPPAQKQRVKEDLSGAFEGVGIQLGYVDSQLAVMAPLKGMPAEAAGVQAGDYILRIKDPTKELDVDTMGMSLPEAVDNIRGKHGVPVTLTLYREGADQPFDATIVRDTIVIPSVEVSFVDSKDGSGKLAHLELSRFGDRTEQEWLAAVSQIKSNPEVEGVILDVRNNPGGYLDGAVFVASEFIDSGVIVRQEGRVNNQQFNVKRKGSLTDTPVVVLINKGSASASEIVAGALRDRLGAKIVGLKSFGKGTVQASETLRQETGIHITTARWVLPNGDWIHETGIAPDIEASNSPDTVDVDEMLEAAIDAF